MNSRLRWVGIAFLAQLTVLPGVAVSSGPDSTVVRTGSAPGNGGVGGMIGGSYFDAGPRNWGLLGNRHSDFSVGAQPRFDFGGRFRYAFTSRWRLQMSTGFTWSAYAHTEPAPFPDPAFPEDLTKEHYLVLLLPATVQLQITLGHRPWLYFAGVGGGAYRVWVESRRTVLMDPKSLRLHRGLYPGTVAELGVERFLRSLPNTSVEASLTHSFALARRRDQFPSGWDGTLEAMALRIGGNYYFEPKVPKKKKS